MAAEETPLICPACRSAAAAHPLDAALRCTHRGCRRRYAELARGVPIVATDAVRAGLPERDQVGDLDGDPRALVGGLPVGSPAWLQAGMAGMYVMSHYADPEAPFAPLWAWARPQLGEPVRRALDLGCGPGRLAIEVARTTGAEVIGLDLDPPSLRWARAVAEAHEIVVPRLATERRFSFERLDVAWADPRPGRVRWLCADGIDAPLPVDAFDLVTCVSYLDNSRDPAAALGVACALTRPGGHLLMATPDAWQTACTPPERWIADSSEGWGDHLRYYGMEVVSVEEAVPWRLQRTLRCEQRFTLYAILARKNTDA